MLKAPLLNPILQRQIIRLQNRQINKNTIYYVNPYSVGHILYFSHKNQIFYHLISDKCAKSNIYKLCDFKKC